MQTVLGDPGKSKQRAEQADIIRRKFGGEKWTVLNNGFVVYIEGKIWSSACVDRTEDENSFDGLLHRKVSLVRSAIHESQI
jgi:hypothetical protein